MTPTERVILENQIEIIRIVAHDSSIGTQIALNKKAKQIRAYIETHDQMQKLAHENALNNL